MSPELSESTVTLPRTSSTRMPPELSCSIFTLPSTWRTSMSPELSAITSTSPFTWPMPTSPELSRTRTLPALSISRSPELSPTSTAPAMRASSRSPELSCKVRDFRSSKVASPLESTASTAMRLGNATFRSMLA